MEYSTEEMTVGQKLRQLRERLKRTDKQWTMEFVGQQVGKTKGAISQYENDENKPSSDVLKSLAKLYGVTVDEILYPPYDGTEYKSAPSGPYEIIEKIGRVERRGPFVNDLIFADPILSNQKASKAQKTKLYLSQLPEKDAESYIPYYDVEITAGKIELYFDDVEEVPEGYVYAPQYKGCVMCNVKGDSMYDRIFPGARLYVWYMSDKKYIDFGQVFLIVLPSERLLKYIYPHPTDENKIILRSHNREKYPDWSVDRVDILHLFKVKGYENQNSI